MLILWFHVGITSTGAGRENQHQLPISQSVNHSSQIKYANHQSKEQSINHTTKPNQMCKLSIKWSTNQSSIRTKLSIKIINQSTFQNKPNEPKQKQQSQNPSINQPPVQTKSNSQKLPKLEIPGSNPQHLMWYTIYIPNELQHFCICLTFNFNLLGVMQNIKW